MRGALRRDLLERPSVQYALVAGLAIFLVLLPQFTSRFYVYLAMRVMLLSLFSLGFNLLFGYSGLLSFGHAAFYAAGAYATGLFLKHAVPSLLPALLVGTLAATFLALVIGVFSVRHTDIYFSMLTLAFGMMVYSVVWKWTDVTGGDNGLIGIPRAPLQLPGGIAFDMGPLQNYYYLVLVLTSLSVAVLHRIVASPFGLVLQGLRENPERVEFSGIPVRRYRLIAFVLSGVFAGLAGSLLAPLENTVGPSEAHWTRSADPVLASLLGGPYAFAGPIVGSALLILIKETIVRYTEHWLFFYGLVLLVLILGFRGGVVGLVMSRLLPPPGESGDG